VCSIESTQDVEVEYADGTKEKPQDVIVGFGESSFRTSSPYIPFGSYMWAMEAMTSMPTMMEPANMGIIQVMATSPAVNVGNVQEIAFSFVGEAAKSVPTIYWDLQAGIDYMENISSAGQSSTSSAAGQSTSSAAAGQSSASSSTGGSSTSSATGGSSTSSSSAGLTTSSLAGESTSSAIRTAGPILATWISSLSGIMMLLSSL